MYVVCRSLDPVDIFHETKPQIAPITQQATHHSGHMAMVYAQLLLRRLPAQQTRILLFDKHGFVLFQRDTELALQVVVLLVASVLLVPSPRASDLTLLALVNVALQSRLIELVRIRRLACPANRTRRCQGHIQSFL